MNRFPIAVTLFLTIASVSTVSVAWTPYGPPPGMNGGAPEALGDSSVPPGRWRSGQVRMTQERTDEHYVLLVELDGLTPENVEVRASGQMLLVRTRVDARRSRSENFGEGRGYRESYQFSTGSSSRRFPVPPDGDVAQLQREDTDDAVRILIPRRGPGGDQ